MKRSPVPLLMSVLALATGALLFPAGAAAIPGNQTPSAIATMPTSDVHAGYQALVPQQQAAADGNSLRQDNISFGSRTCRRDIAGDQPADNITTGKQCVDDSDARRRFSIQLGRRVGTRDDILGEFDGVRVDYRLGDGLNLNGIAGFPVVAAGDQFNPARQLFGISATTNRVDRAWDLNSFLIEQQENGQVTGRSMGGAIRYLRPGRSLLVYLDYDVAGNSLGTLMASGAWKLPFKTTLSATLDLRNRPIPGRQQKFLQQSMTVTDGWNWILPTEQLAYSAGDGSSEVSILAVGLSHALSKRIKLSGDVAVLDAATTAPSNDYFYHLKLTGKDLMIRGGRSKLDMRYYVTDSGRTSAATFDTKYAINRFWNVISRLRARYHNPALESSPRWVASPAVTMEFRPNKQYGIHIEAGGEMSNGEYSSADNNRSSYFLSLGYQAKF